MKTSQPMSRILTFLLFFSLVAQTAPLTVAGKETRVIPDRFLREYDPITIFLSENHRLPVGVPVDTPPAWLRLEPKHPGRWSVIDRTTLQFTPTTSWPPLSRFTLSVHDRAFTLTTLIDAPEKVFPAPGSRNLDPFRDLGFVFRRELPVNALAEMLRIEVRPLPGLDASHSMWMTSDDFVVKELARENVQDNTGILVTLNREIPFEKKVLIHLALCLDPSLTDSEITYEVETRPLFRLTALGAGSDVLPVGLNGAVSAQENAISLGTQRTPLFLEFNAPLAEVHLTQIKNMVRFQPVVENLSFDVSGSRILLHFEAQPEIAYRLEIKHEQIRDRKGRVLAPFGEVSAYFFLPKAQPVVRWRQNVGIVERFGPQMCPLEVRGEQQVDLRIFKIDPLNENFWPFPESGVVVDEAIRPAGPGEEPLFMDNIEEQIRQLGVPQLSRVIDLPSPKSSDVDLVGLDLRSLFQEISGEGQPGTYLIGTRQLGTSRMRQYVRLQVTDLSLTVIEEESGITFCVSSLNTGEPISGARVTMEARPQRRGERRMLFEGTTNAQGLASYTHRTATKSDLYRIAVTAGSDALVVDPQEPPPQFYDNHWYGSYYSWLSWLRRSPVTQKDEAVSVAHVFAERPVHRPEEPVHLKGYIRLVQHGQIEPASKDEVLLIVEGPGDRQWTYPLALNTFGSFYVKFDEKDVPTGDYRVWVKQKKGGAIIGSTSFKKESYRIPRFEIRVTGPDRTPLDRAFQLTATAMFYAGGRVVGHDATWEVTQRPYRFQPPEYPGFAFSTDTRFADGGPPDTSSKIHKQDTTDATGSSMLKIDPTQEPDATPRTYHARVTIRGADEQTVTADKFVQALPPFIIGVKTDRLVDEAKPIRAQVVVLDFDGKALAGQEVRLKLYHRQWHSYLRQSDFTTGEAKYVTEVVDVPIETRTVESKDQTLDVAFTVADAGVYVVEASAKDRLGRRQVVMTDLFVSGETPVAWQKPENQVLDVVWDQERYAPGDEATLILKSPNQNTRALVIVEGREANAYHWVSIRGGKGLFRLATQVNMTPKIPVHVLLMQGRTPQRKHSVTALGDVGKPMVLAATAWLNVRPDPFRLNVQLNHPETNLPGSSMPMTLTVVDAQGRPIDGEATLWLVDRAVLALGKEGELDPLPTFLQPGRAWIRIRDTRNQAIGIPTDADHPAGDGLAERKSKGFFDSVTVRKNFKTVPYYNPNIMIKDGRAELTIPLPDNLTEFAVRVVVTDGWARFGVAKSRLAVRLPLIVQSALPRFVRPKDRFEAGGIGRVVEGEGGPGMATLEVVGLNVSESRTRPIDWVPDQPQTLFFPMEVTTPAATLRDAANHVTVRLGVLRDHDQARDAFEIELPVRPERTLQTEQFFALLKPGDRWTLPKPVERAESGSLQVKITVSSQAALIKALAGLDYLHGYDHGCLEQRISQVMPLLALRDVWLQLGVDAATHLGDLQIEDALAALDWALHDDGLYSYWPGSQGKVHLTAYVVEFLVLARDRDQAFEPRFLDRGIAALKEALRTDYGFFVSGYKDAERTQALQALAQAGELDVSYALELAARAQQLDPFSEASILHTFLAHDLERGTWVAAMIDDLWSRISFAQRDGQQVYAGLQSADADWGGPILSSETRTLAGMLRALTLADARDPRLQVLERALIDLGEGDGWGSTQANAAALLALGERLAATAQTHSAADLAWSHDDQMHALDFEGKSVAVLESHDPGPAELIYRSSEGEPHLAWIRLSYLPRDPGAETPARSNGFVVSRKSWVFEKLDAPPRRETIRSGKSLSLTVGDVVEEQVNLVNPEDRYYVAVRIPFAAGLEPLNPNLATAPPYAQPTGKMTRNADYALFEDDRVTYYFDYLPKGTFDFFLRLEASISGTFTQPPARAEMMYHLGVFAQSPGCRVDIAPRKKDE